MFGVRVRLRLALNWANSDTTDSNENHPADFRASANSVKVAANSAIVISPSQPGPTTTWNLGIGRRRKSCIMILSRPSVPLIASLTIESAPVSTEKTMSNPRLFSSWTSSSSLSCSWSSLKISGQPSSPRGMLWSIRVPPCGRSRGKIGQRAGGTRNTCRLTDSRDGSTRRLVLA